MSIPKWQTVLLSRPRWLAFCVSFLPLMSVLMAMILSGGEQPPNPEPAPPTHAGAEPAPQQSPPVLFLLIMLTLLSAKVAGIIGSFRCWYYAWVYHALEFSLVIFLLGVFVVMGVLSIPLSIVGTFKVLMLALVVVFNLLLRGLWLDKQTKDRYHVARVTQP